MNYLWFALIVVVCYFIGNINFARIVARIFKKEDITTKGSGNPGTMNMLRNYGVGFAALTLLLECLKSGVPAIVCGYIFAPQGLFEVAFFTAGFSVVLGHNFPVFYKFKGGKGIACIAGTFFFSPLWYVGLIMFVVCCVFLYFVDYGFLASIIFVTTLSIAWIVRLALLQPFMWWVALIIVVLIMLSGYIMHHSNIRRFVKGTEKHTNFKKSVDKLFTKKQKVDSVDETPEKEIIVEDNEPNAPEQEIVVEDENSESEEKQEKDGGQTQ